jgi:SAM-dependent methyltransferase
MNTSEAEIVRRIAGYFPSRWLAGYARGKLRTDPVYRASFERLSISTQPLLDIGCGTGLHAFYLRERGFKPGILGIDVDTAKIEAGRRIASEHYENIELRVGDGAALPEFSGHVSMLDVLHYFAPEVQQRLLKDIAARVAPGAFCILRLTPRDGSWRFRATQLLESFARGIGWMTRPAVTFPTLESVAACFPALEFEHEIRPLWGRTPFNSWLLAFRRR